MPTNLTFDSLKEDLRRYLERGSVINDDIVADQIPRLINGAERKLAQILKLLGQIEALVDPVGLTQGVSVITKPDRWRQTVSMWYGKGSDNNVRTPILPRSYEYARSYWPDSDEQDEPLFYADYDYNHWLIVPTPNAGFPLEVLCWMQPQLLDAANQTNFFSDYCPSALLYGSLLEATPFLKDDSRIPTWQGLWEQELTTLTIQDSQRIYDRAAQRTRP